MIYRAPLLAVAATVVTASASLAQQNESIPRFAADVRGVITGLPSPEGWTPRVPAGTRVPTRGSGLSAGAQVYLVHYKLFALGVGGSVLIGGGHVSTKVAATGSSAPPPASLPDVTTRVRSVTPELTLNFGKRMGWSYLVVGLRRSNVKSEATSASTATSPALVERTGVKTLNYGGGARWFINDHIAFNLDLRWYKINPVPALVTAPAAPRASLVVAGAGVSIKLN